MNQSLLIRLCLVFFTFFFHLNGVQGNGMRLPTDLETVFREGAALYDAKEYVKATAIFEQLLERTTQQKDILSTVNLYYHLGIFYDLKGIQSKALEYLFEAIDFLSKENKSTPQKTYFIAHKNSKTNFGSPYSNEKVRDLAAEFLCLLYLRTGGVYYNQKDYTKAQKYWQKSLDFAQANQQQKALSSALNNLGEIYRLNGNLAAALPLYLQSLSIKKMLKDTIGMNTNLSNIGTVHLKLGQLDSAKYYYDKAYEGAPRLGKRKSYYMVMAYDNYGLYYKTTGAYKAAISSYQKGLEFAEQRNDVPFRLSLLQELAFLHEKVEQLDSALFFQKKWMALNKDLNLQKKEKLALEIEAQYLISEKEKEFTYLKEKSKIKAQNTSLNSRLQLGLILGLLSLLSFLVFALWQYNRNSRKRESHIREIDQQNAEKDILLKEIHHRVKNNLQVITSLLGLQSFNIEDPKIKEIFSYSQYRIQAMGIVHEMLYQSNNLSSINYKEYLEQLLESLINSIKGSNNNVICQIDVPNIYLNIDTAIPLGLLINEVVTNALKYGIPNNNEGRLDLKITQLDAPNYKLEIGDNGPGFSDEINYRTTNSLGLKLIRKLTVQLNGSIEKDSTKKGTNYILNFKEIE